MYGISRELCDDDSLKVRAHSAIAAHKHCTMREGHIAETVSFFDIDVTYFCNNLVVCRDTHSL